MMDKKDSISEILKDLIFLNEKYSVFGDSNIDTDFYNFDRKVLDKFKVLEEKCLTEQDRDKLGDEMIKILKDFHVHWNSLRLKD